MAVTTAQRLGLTPTFAQRDRRSFPVDGRYNSAEAPDAPGIPSTRGYSREPRPDRTQVRLDGLVEHPAGIPLLLTPRSGPTRDTSDGGPVVSQHRQPLQLPSGTTSLVADRALYSAENLQQLAHTQRQGITRVPAPLTAAPAALAAASPETRAPLREGSRSHVLAST